MFQPLIEDARNMIARLHQSAEKGRDHVPSSVMMRYSEFQSWENAVQAVARLVFGEESPALERWHMLVNRRDALVTEAMRKDVKRGEFFGMIDYFHLAIGVLREFEAAYQHQLTVYERGPEPSPTVTTVNGTHNGASHTATNHAPSPELPLNRAEPRQRVARLGANEWEVLITVNDHAYDWLSDVVAARDASGLIAPEAIAHLAATIIERVAAQSRRPS
ncbi:hypothetical protein SE17_05700 [Kouleothrix aurantiaca]|uniref:Uncharacterized protein n=1 Tax=Kouleothrix aurantiaca TaxID=186479 RepID=A0A0P9FBP0_9CHLR|nr:hypothetical protein SE17_05700 [Kouleothrix aurantiaca]